MVHGTVRFTEQPPRGCSQLLKGTTTVSGMNCDEAKLEIALWVGNDLDDPARIEELRRHIATCPDCRLRTKSLQSSMVVLGAVDQDRTYDPGDSLWPELQSRIDYLERTPKPRFPTTKWALALVAVVGVGVGGWSMLQTPPAEPQVQLTPEVEPEPAKPVHVTSPGLSHSQYLPGQGP